MNIEGSQISKDIYLVISPFNLIPTDDFTFSAVLAVLSPSYLQIPRSFLMQSRFSKEKKMNTFKRVNRLIRRLLGIFARGGFLQLIFSSALQGTDNTFLDATALLSKFKYIWLRILSINNKIKLIKKMLICLTICPKSLDQFYLVTYYIKWVESVKTFWT